MARGKSKHKWTVWCCAALLCGAGAASGQSVPEGRGKDIANGLCNTCHALSARVVDPKTLVIREYTLPDAASRPRRITVTSDDILWFVDFSRGFLGRLDPKTAQFQSWPLPGGGDIVRNTSVTPDGDFVLANSLVNAVTLVTVPK